MSECVRRSQRRALPEVQSTRVEAASVTLLAHVLFAALVLREPPVASEQPEEEIVTNLIFIERPQVTKVVRSIEVVQLSAARYTRQERPPVIVTQTVKSKVQSPAAEAPLAAEVQGRQNLKLQEPDFTFAAPDPLRRPAKEPFAASVPRLRLRMSDSSWAGRLQAMQKGSICGELHASLLKEAESAEAILASMAEIGCKI